MAAPPPPPPPRAGGLSLYDNLLDPNDPSSTATISSAPVLYNQPDAAASDPFSKKSIDPALRFQPIRRPQAKQSKPKTIFPKAIISKPAAAPVAPPKTTLADWAVTEEDEWKYGVGEKRARGGRKRKNKKKQEAVQAETDWDELYDPARPTNVEEYLRSDEKIDEVREWKDLLYRHRMQRDESDVSDDDDEDGTSRMPQNQFAPPPSYAFAPPPPQSPPPSRVDDNTGDDAYARRFAMATAQTTQPASLPPPPPPPPPPLSEPQTSNPPPPAPSDSATISRAPVRYSQPPPPGEDEEMGSPPPALGSGNDNNEEEPRSSRPGQAGFAQRLMSRYGWTEGTGLGANESGIVNPLRVQVDKRRKKADADGGGWAEPGGKGKIIGGRRKEQGGKFGTMSEVIVLQNMLENMPDLQTEIEQGLGQEIGEECGEKYGRVERLYIDQTNRQVFIKFTNQVSALRAVNELDGRVFNGNEINPKFYDTEKFDKGLYT
ncbi:hypothetical protein S40285_07137 [Stachybotrys chlorohalonatus IBT 40285]|uniref:G-patch domain-containing protein n=1 Tax=Stachybotrys chlorohalonatus (strain IBT 40285) TaxID=1283841 RepID=A0A084QL50_STAC4|nr:hypothetical protein S40285_07137 [Stachybotrys chlorohalonata IBT 40285]